MAKKRYRYNIIQERSKGGYAAVWMAGISCFFFILDILLSYYFEGKGGLLLGAIGLFSMATAAYGFYVGMRSFQESRVSHRLSAIGSIASGVLAMLWLGLFILGL